MVTRDNSYTFLTISFIVIFSPKYNFGRSLRKGKLNDVKKMDEGDEISIRVIVTNV